MKNSSTHPGDGRVTPMKRQRIIAGLLTVIAALLAANLVLGSAQAQRVAQPPLRHAVAITVDSGSLGGLSLYRLWSDGTVDHRTKPRPQGAHRIWHEQEQLRLSGSRWTSPLGPVISPKLERRSTPPGS